MCVFLLFGKYAGCDAAAAKWLPWARKSFLYGTKYFLYGTADTTSDNQYFMLKLVYYNNTHYTVFVSGWRHALRSEWPFIIIIIIITQCIEPNTVYLFKI